MGPSCSIFHLFSSTGCFEILLQRFQGLFVGSLGFLLGLASLAVAFMSLTNARKQRRLSEMLAEITLRNQEITMNEKTTERALAIVALDAFLDAAHHAYHSCIGGTYHYEGQTIDGQINWNWQPVALTKFNDVKIPSDIATVAATAFPEGAADIVQLSNAVEAVQALSTEFAAQPWEPSNGDTYDGAQRSDRDRQKSNATDQAINRVGAFVSKTAKFQAHIRG